MKTLILSALAMLAVAEPSLAGPYVPPRAASVSVAYADLDLSQAKDAAIMLKRIRRAASDACRQAQGNDARDTETLLRVEACYRRALADAVAGLNAPRVTEAFAPTRDQKRLARLP